LISLALDIPPRIAIVGCGAVVERFHLPASRFVPELSIEFLVDCEQARARRLADLYNIPKVAAEFREVIGKVDAAIVALPHKLNADVSRELLNEGISVLVEKPMAFTAAEGEQLLAVQLIRRALKDNFLGTVTKFSVEDGYPFNWRSAGADFRLDKRGGGGVLLDVGCHVLDMLVFWFGALSVQSALNDSLGGVEVNAFAELETAMGVPGTIELSWERLLRNSAIIEGTAGRLEVEWYSNSATAYLNGSTLRGIAVPEGSKQEVQSFDMMFVEQLHEWARVLRGKSEGQVLATGRDAARVLQLVEDCRSQGKTWQQSWSSVTR
jgi:predicted dehydrogenase